MKRRSRPRKSTRLHQANKVTFSGDEAQAGSRLGVSGTPAFFVNGRKISGAQPGRGFAQIIDDELARAK